jgi:hypothetical protein
MYNAAIYDEEQAFNILRNEILKNPKFSIRDRVEKQYLKRMHENNLSLRKLVASPEVCEILKRFGYPQYSSAFVWTFSTSYTDYSKTWYFMSTLEYCDFEEYKNQKDKMEYMQMFKDFYAAPTLEELLAFDERIQGRTLEEAVNSYLSIFSKEEK